MISTTSEYKTKVRDRERSWDIKGTITPLTGTAVTIDKADLELGGLKCVESVIGSGKLTLGGGIMGDISATLINSTGKFNSVNLSGAKFVPEVRLEKTSGTFFDWIPLGVFNIDEVRDSVTSIGIKGFDNLVYFDRPFSDLSITFPQTAKQLLGSICAQVGVAFKTSTFTNESYNIPAAPVDEVTCREMLVYIGQLVGGWVRCDREGKLEVVSIRKPSNATKDFEITPSDRYSFKTDEPTVITGVTLEVGDDVYLSGTDTYTIDLGPNPLFSASIQATLNNIKTKVNSLSYSAIEFEWVGDPAVQAGDIVKNTDRGGKVHYSFVGSTSYAFRGSGRITCGSVSGITSKYINPTQRALKSVKLVSGQQAETNNKMDSLEQAVNSATNLLVNANGLFRHEVDGVLYFTAEPNLQTSQKVWTFGSEGFGFSSTGWQGPFVTSITADNSITAQTITASMIKAGTLLSNNGKSWLKMNDGTFSFGDGALTWDGTNLAAKGVFRAEKTVGGKTGRLELSPSLISSAGEFSGGSLRFTSGTELLSSVNFYHQPAFGGNPDKSVVFIKAGPQTGDLSRNVDSELTILTDKLTFAGANQPISTTHAGSLSIVSFHETALSVTGDASIWGNLSVGNGDITMPNLSKLLAKDAGGTPRRISVITQDNNLILGSDSLSGDTIIMTHNDRIIKFVLGTTLIGYVDYSGIRDRHGVLKLAL